MEGTKKGISEGPNELIVGLTGKYVMSGKFDGINDAAITLVGTDDKGLIEGNFDPGARDVSDV
jgi:hypothetical protein